MQVNRGRQPTTLSQFDNAILQIQAEWALMEDMIPILQAQGRLMTGGERTRYITRLLSTLHRYARNNNYLRMSWWRRHGLLRSTHTMSDVLGDRSRRISLARARTAAFRRRLRRN
jgi:hypothetical protein